MRRTQTALLRFFGGGRRLSQFCSRHDQGVRSRPKSVFTRQFGDERNRGLSHTQGRRGAGARPGPLGVKTRGPCGEQMAGLLQGHVARQPSALTLTPTENNLELSMCLIFGLREEAAQTRIKPATPPVRAAPCHATTEMPHHRAPSRVQSLPSITSIVKR